MSAVYTHSSACDIPTMRAQEPARTGFRRDTPILPNTKPIRAFSDASRTSIASVIVAPMPTAAPLIAPITGFLQAKILSVTRSASVADAVKNFGIIQPPIHVLERRTQRLVQAEHVARSREVRPDQMNSLHRRTSRRLASLNRAARRLTVGRDCR